MTLDAGQFTSVEYDTVSKAVTLHLAAATTHVANARLRLAETVPGSSGATYEVTGQKLEAGAYLIPLNAEETTVAVHTR